MKEFEKIPEWFSKVELAGGVGLTSKKTTSISTIFLEPGTYVMECYVRMPNGMPHTFMGMVKELKVSEETNGNKAPKADYNINIASEKGITFIENSRTKQQMPHYFQFFEDFANNEERLTIKLAVKKIKIPMLIIHGEADTTVMEKEARLLHQWNPLSELKVLEKADHSFGTRHPWKAKNLPKDLKKVVESSLSFLNKLTL